MIGIRDADFLHLADKETIPENIFLTDFHDAEMMMISCDNSYWEFLQRKRNLSGSRKVSDRSDEEIAEKKKKNALRTRDYKENQKYLGSSIPVANEISV